MAETVASVLDLRPASAPSASPPPLPRITIRFCTQCKWMLRAAYFAQELLSTFSTSLGEVALQPATGGVFIVEIHHRVDPASSTSVPGPDPTIQSRILWDRKADGGFPETKELKRRVRDVIEPGRNLGHVDRDYPRQQQSAKDGSKSENGNDNSDGTTATPDTEQAQQQKQPLGPRWPQPNQPGSSQSTAREQQPGADPRSEPSASPDAQITPQIAPGDLGPYSRRQAADTDGPVYDPRMPGGGIMPVVPPVVAPSSRFVIQDDASQTQSAPRNAQEECEDCQ
ncbi:hypothetical protein F5Y14DRAFT_418749 [Nemania sp. NC0429]|nr:hypothetical protein F5Y14DRAFT_418749 [Nemania sp. NC0429]